MQDLIRNHLVYFVESIVILSILVFVAHVLYSLGWFNLKK
jgi:hypothetical protein